jgi:cytochrome P450
METITATVSYWYGKVIAGEFSSLSLYEQVLCGSSLFSIAICVYFVLLFLSQCWQLRNFRGPLAIPLVGNCYQAEALYLLRYLSKLRKRFGKNFTFFAFTKPYLVVCDPNAVRRILTDSKLFAKGKDYTETFGVAFGQGLVTSNGERHHKDKAVFFKYFIRSSIAKHMSMVNAKTSSAINEMLNKNSEKGVLSHCATGGRVYNIEHFFAILSLRVFSQFAMSHDFKGSVDGREEEEWIAAAVSEGSWTIGRMITLGLPMWNLFPAVKKVRDNRDGIWKLMKAVVDERKARMSAGTAEEDDCLTAMIQENMSEVEMRDHIVTLLSAGHDTTAYFTSYLCFLLATHPDVQKRLRDHIVRTLNGRTEVTADDVAEMKYLQNVMQECLRLYSIIPCVTRLSTQPIHIKECNIHIPKNANILIPMFLINRDPDLWEEPSKFNPDRFEGSTGFFTSPRNGYFPFGYGSRTCIGNTLAQMESAVFIVKILLKFELSEDVGFKPAIFAGISLTTSNGINIKMKEL